MTRKKHYHTKGEMAWLLDNDKSFPAIVESDDVVYLDCDKSLHT
jgi:hypothetical protein